MRNLLKKVVFYMVLGGCLVLGVEPSMAQTFSLGIVNINAIDAETLQPHNGTIAMGSEQRSGQGIIIDPAGIIATNKHIIGNAPQHIYVKLLGGRTFEAKIIQNSQADLTLLKINAPFPLPAITLGDSSQIQIGNRVLAFANAGLNPQQEQNGEVIQLYREVPSDTVAILEVNIRLKPGDSGGPILNEQGLLLGLIMANQISDATKSYAIASNKIRREYWKFKQNMP